MDNRALRKKVTLQSPPSGQDAAGQPSGSWTTVATVYADVRYLSGLETIKGGAEVSAVKASVRIRWRATITAGWRVVAGSVTYEVQAVMPDAAKRFIDLACEVVS